MLSQQILKFNVNRICINSLFLLKKNEIMLSAHYAKTNI